MTLIFIISLLGMILMLPLHFFSVEHKKFIQKFGEQKGQKITKILAMISGWGFFLFLFGIWIAPQPDFFLPNFNSIIWKVTLWCFDFNFYLVNLIIAVLFIIPGAYLGIAGVKELSLEVAETHQADELITSGIYSKIRHPQYLGAILSHIGMSWMFAGSYALWATPFVILYNYLTAWKEEKELIKEFGEAYKKYKETIPMLIPWKLSRG